MSDHIQRLAGLGYGAAIGAAWVNIGVPEMWMLLVGVSIALTADFVSTYKDRQE